MAEAHAANLRIRPVWLFEVASRIPVSVRSSDPVVMRGAP
jgi:hypothetical protein